MPPLCPQASPLKFILGNKCKKPNLLEGVAHQSQVLMGVSPRGLAAWLKIAARECSPICGFFPSVWEGFWLYLITWGRAEALKGGAVWAVPLSRGSCWSCGHRHHGHSFRYFTSDSLIFPFLFTWCFFTAFPFPAQVPG